MWPSLINLSTLTAMVCISVIAIDDHLSDANRVFLVQPPYGGMYHAQAAQFLRTALSKSIDDMFSTINQSMRLLNNEATAGTVDLVELNHSNGLVFKQSCDLIKDRLLYDERPESSILLQTMDRINSLVNWDNSHTKLLKQDNPEKGKGKGKRKSEE